MADMGFSKDNSRILLWEKNRFKLFFYWSPHTLEQIIYLIKEWGFAAGADRDGLICLRLLFEDVLGKISVHAAEPGSPLKCVVDLKFFGESHDIASRHVLAPSFSIRLRYNGTPYNPLEGLELSPDSLFSVPENDENGEGALSLSLLTLFTTRRRYQRKDGVNELRMHLPLSMHKKGKDRQRDKNIQEQKQKPGAIPFIQRWWRKSLSFRQASVLMLTSLVILWGGALFFHAAMKQNSQIHAHNIGLYALSPQRNIIKEQIESFTTTVNIFTGHFASLLENDAIFTDEERLEKNLENLLSQNGCSIPQPVVGLFWFDAGTGKTRFYNTTTHILQYTHFEGLSRYLSRVSGGRDYVGWVGPLLPASGSALREGNALAAWVCRLPSGKTGQGVYMGVVIDISWSEHTIKRLSGLPHVWPVIWNKWGEFLVAPPEKMTYQNANNGFYPEFNTRWLNSRLQAGERDVLQLDIQEGARQLPWPGKTSLAYYASEDGNWFFGMLIPDSSMGYDPALPLSILLLLGFCGSALLGGVCWWATTKATVPFGDLADSLELLCEGELGTPLPDNFGEDEAGLLLEAFEQTRIILKGSLQNLLETTEAQKRMNNELELARLVQESTLPAYPFTRFSVPGVEVGALLLMAQEVCGDLYDVFSSARHSGQICCLVGDVCGKGLPASLLMCISTSLAKSALMDGASPAETLARLNRALCRNNTSNVFVTMLAGILDTNTGRFLWASAGHPPPVIGLEPENIKPEPSLLYENAEEDNTYGTIAQMLPWSGDLVLGIRPDIEYKSFEVHLKPGQSILLYSDGASEAMGPASTSHEELLGNTSMFGEDRLIGAFTRACIQVGTEGVDDDDENTASAIVTRIRESLQSYMQGTTLNDDITLMVLRRQPE